MGVRQRDGAGWSEESKMKIRKRSRRKWEVGPSLISYSTASKNNRAKSIFVPLDSSESVHCKNVTVIGQQYDSYDDRHSNFFSVFAMFLTMVSSMVTVAPSPHLFPPQPPALLKENSKKNKAFKFAAHESAIGWCVFFFSLSHSLAFSISLSLSLSVIHRFFSLQPWCC